MSKPFTYINTVHTLQKKLKTDYSNKHMQQYNDNITPVMSLLSCCIHVGVCFVFTGADYVHMKFPSAELQLLQDAMTQNVQDVAPPPLPTDSSD